MRDEENDSLILPFLRFSFCFFFCIVNDCPEIKIIRLKSKCFYFIYTFHLSLSHHFNTLISIENHCTEMPLKIENVFIKFHFNLMFDLLMNYSVLFFALNLAYERSAYSLCYMLFKKLRSKCVEQFSVYLSFPFLFIVMWQLFRYLFTHLWIWIDKSIVLYIEYVCMFMLIIFIHQ